MITRRAFGLGTVLTGAQSAKKPKGHTMSTPSLRGTVTADGTNAGDPVTVLVDGAETPITANGLAGYQPITGDRLLIARVGGQVEVIQFLDKTQIVGQTVLTAPSGQRWEITSGDDPSAPNTIRGFSSNAFIAPGTLETTNTAPYAIEMISPDAGGGAGPATFSLSSDFSGNYASIETLGGFFIQNLLSGAVGGIKALNFGTISPTMATGQSTATTGAIAHNLGFTPTFVGVMPNASTSAYVGYLAGPLTSTQFNLGIKLLAGTAGSPTVINALWFAIC